MPCTAVCSLRCLSASYRLILGSTERRGSAIQNSSEANSADQTKMGRARYTIFISTFSQNIDMHICLQVTEVLE